MEAKFSAHFLNVGGQDCYSPTFFLYGGILILTPRACPGVMHPTFILGDVTQNE